MKVDLCGEWALKCSPGSIPAVVPGDYYSDLQRAGFLSDPYFSDNALKTRELPLEADYIRHFDLPADSAYDHALLRFFGVDTLARIDLNGTLLGFVDNMHRIWEFDVTHLLRVGDNKLTVSFSSPVDYIREKHEACPLRSADDSMPGIQHLRKAHYMMGWDFAPELPNIGLFRPVELELARGGRLESVTVTQNGGRENAVIEVAATAELYGSESASLYVHITAPDGTVETVIAAFPPGSGKREARCEYRVLRPALWWPNGMGEQPLYTVETSLIYAGDERDSVVRRIGLRSIELCTSPDEYGKEFYFRVNGSSIFAMGANYVPEDSLPSRRSPERTARLLDDCVAANFNMIRVWGGGFYSDDLFFDLCDERGLLVWQDFMFACCFLSDDESLKSNIAAEVREIAGRIGDHACLALFCGNNEIEEAIACWEGWTADELTKKVYLDIFEEMIPSILSSCAPHAAYIPSSPTSGGGFKNTDDTNVMDSHYWKVWHKHAPYESYRDYYFRFCSEMGFESFPSIKTFRDYTKSDDALSMFSPQVEYRQRCKNGNLLILQNAEQHYLMPESFETTIYVSQLMQADAMRFGAEHMRRHRGRCMGMLYWQLNDCWSGVSWSGIDYEGRWKLLHYAAREFYAPTLLILTECEKRVVLSVSNERPGGFKGTVRWRLCKNDFTVLRFGELAASLSEYSSADLGEIDFSDLPEEAERECFLSAELTDEGGTVICDQALLFVQPKAYRFNDPQLRAHVSVRDDRYSITIYAQSYAQNVWVDFENTDCVLSRNGFSVSSENPVTLQVEQWSGKPPEIDNLKLLSVYDIGREKTAAVNRLSCAYDIVAMPS